MTKAVAPKPNTFIRDQFILTVILLIALLCRHSLVSSTTVSNDTVAKRYATSSEEVVASVR